MYELMNDYPVHTKAVLINDRLSVVGSYNLDMRSTYLDTELMLVIDSEKLSQQIHETESDYMEKAKRYLQTVRNRRRKVPGESVESEKEVILRCAQDYHSSSSAAALECVWKIIPKISCKL